MSPGHNPHHDPPKNPAPSRSSRARPKTKEADRRVRPSSFLARHSPDALEIACLTPPYLPGECSGASLGVVLCASFDASFELAGLPASFALAVLVALPAPAFEPGPCTTATLPSAFESPFATLASVFAAFRT